MAGGGGAAVSTYQNRCATGGGGGYQTIPVELSEGTYEIVIGLGGAAKEKTTYGTVKAGNGGNTTAFGGVCTGGGGAYCDYEDTAGGSAGSPNGKAGKAPTTVTANAAGGSPNGGRYVSGGDVYDGGDGYVELTFS